MRIDESDFCWSTLPPKRTVLVWAALIAAPLSFLVAEGIRYSLVPQACLHGWGTAALHLGAAVALAIAVAGVLIARSRIRSGDHEPGSAHHYIAVLAIAECAFFVVAVFGQWLPTFIVGPCQH